MLLLLCARRYSKGRCALSRMIFATFLLGSACLSFQPWGGFVPADFWHCTNLMVMQSPALRKGHRMTGSRERRDWLLAGNVPLFLAVEHQKNKNDYCYYYNLLLSAFHTRLVTFRILHFIFRLSSSCFYRQKRLSLNALLQTRTASFGLILLQLVPIARRSGLTPLTAALWESVTICSFYGKVGGGF